MIDDTFIELPKRTRLFTRKARVEQRLDAAGVPFPALFHRVPPRRCKQRIGAALIFGALFARKESAPLKPGSDPGYPAAGKNGCLREFREAGTAVGVARDSEQKVVLIQRKRGLASHCALNRAYRQGMRHEEGTPRLL